MKVLLLGGGGREHALGWKLSQGKRLDKLISVPGNPGLAQLGEAIPDVDMTDPDGVVHLAISRAIDLVIVGPEAPLAAGVTDALVKADVPCWGPSRAAAELETSKAYAKEMMDLAGVRTAGWKAFIDRTPALDQLASQAPPYVIKANGLAAGKGVLVTDDLAEAGRWVDRCLGGDFGEARLVVEDFLDGPELSVFALCSGEQALPLQPARDFKRLHAGDQGPNTGGMGAYSPVEGLPSHLLNQTINEVIKPVLKTMADYGRPYTGFLCAGLVMTHDGPMVLEFNCRLGDPETQVVLPRLENDLIDLIEAGLAERLDEQTLAWSNRSYLNVVMAAPGYPESPQLGGQVAIGALPAGAMIFHAGTRRVERGLVANGGRVLNVVGSGKTLNEARANAYSAVGAVDYPGAQYRSDI